ncbi:MAG: hypothetical protein ACREBS_02535 [Nitrososphaerales archaeon]
MLGEDVVQTLYFAISEKFRLPKKEFLQKPLEVVNHLREILGEDGFRIPEKAIISQIRETFEIREGGLDLIKTIELAKRNYLQYSL